MATAVDPAASDARDGDRVVLPGEHRHLAELDGIRGLAIAMVLACHLLGSLDGVLGKIFHDGWVGVDLFFVLSGYLITSLLAERREKPHYFRGFYRRRALRILPAYFALLIWEAAAGHLRGAALWMNAIFLGNFLIHNPIRVLWSVCVEEHFYLVWPTPLRFLGLRAMVVVCAAICVATPILRYAYPSGAVYVQTWARLDALAFGAALACIAGINGKRDVLRRFSFGAALLAVGMALVLLATGAMSRTTRLGAALQLSTVDLAAVAVLAFTVAEQGRSLTAPFRWRLPRYLGRISYGLYLYHQSVHRLCVGWMQRADGPSDHASVTAAILALVISVALAHLSFVYLETWFLHRKAPRERTAIAGGGTPTAAAVR